MPALLLALTSHALGTDEPGGPGSYSDDRPAPPAVDVADTTQRQSFHELSEPITGEDVLSPSGRAVLTAGFAAQAGANPDLAQRVGANAERIFLVPARGQLCILVEDGTTELARVTCNDTQSARDGRLFLSENTPDLAVVAGVLPDTAHDVAVDAEGTAPQPEQVRNNGYSFSYDDSEDRQLEWSDGRSENQVEIPTVASPE